MKRLSWEKHQELSEVPFWKGFKTASNAFNSHHDFFERIYQDYMKTIHTRRFKRALDIGIGASGGFVSVIRQIKIKHGLDPMVDELKEMLPWPKKINYVNGFGEEIPFEDNFFDLVIISNALEHTKNAEQVVKEIKRVLCPNGIFVYFTYLLNDKFHPRSFDTIEEARDILGLKDFNICEEHYVTSTNSFRNRNPHFIGVYNKK